MLFSINAQQITPFISPPSWCLFDGELARWAPDGIESLGGYFCLVLLWEVPSPGVTCAFEIEHGKSNPGFQLTERCSLCILQLHCLNCLGGQSARVRASPEPGSNLLLRGVPLGVLLLYPIPEQYGQGSQVTERLHQLPFLLFFGKSLVKRLGVSPVRVPVGAVAVVPLRSSETLLAGVLGPARGLPPALPVCASARDERDTAVWHNPNSPPSTLFPEEPLLCAWSCWMRASVYALFCRKSRFQQFSYGPRS